MEMQFPQSTHHVKSNRKKVENHIRGSTKKKKKSAVKTVNKQIRAKFDVIDVNQGQGSSSYIHDEATKVKAELKSTPVVSYHQEQSVMETVELRKPRPHNNKKKKKTGKPVPRGSITLDGAIRNLEFAIKQEQKSAPATETESFLKSDHEDDELEMPSSLFGNNNESIQLTKKSGYDFLDNW